MSVKFTDNSMKVKSNLEGAVESLLAEQSGELVSQIVRNSRTDGAQTKGSYQYKVLKVGNEATAYIGSDYANAIWEEFGTGEYALNGDGAKPYWVFVKDKKKKPQLENKGHKTYTLEKAKQIMAMLRADGLEAYYTKGKKPNRPMYRAFATQKPKIEKRFKEVFKNS